jgi:hypothetical protein
MSIGNGPISTNQKKEQAGAPFAAGSAVNGASVDALGRIVLGNDIGAPGNPGQLLSSREIETNAFDVLFINGGFTLRLSAAGAFVTDPTANKAAGIDGNGFLSISDNTAANNPLISFQNNTAPTADFRLQDDVFQFEKQGSLPVLRILLTPENVLIGPNLVDNGSKLQVEGHVSMLSAVANLDFPLTAPFTSSDLTIALAAAAVGDMVVGGFDPAGLDANSCYTYFVDAPGSVTVRFNNYSAAAIDPAARDFTVSILKPL